MPSIPLTFPSLLNSEKIFFFIAHLPCQRLVRTVSNYDTNTKWNCLFKRRACKANANFFEFLFHGFKC